MKVITKWAFIILFTISFNISAKGNSSEIPLELFGELEYIRSPVLSPDGKSIAMLLAIDGVYNVAVADFEERRPKLIFKPEKNAQSRMQWVDWANNDRIIVSYSWRRELAYMKSRQGKALIFSRLMAVDKDGKNIKSFEYDIKKNMRGSVYERAQRDTNPFYQDNVIDTLPKDKDHILLSIDGDVDAWVDHVYKLNVYTGKYSFVKKNFQNIHYWLTDNHHELRLGIAFDENVKGRVEYHYKIPQTSKWTKIFEYVLFKDKDNGFMGFDQTGDKLYFASNKDTDTTSLYSFDLKTRRMNGPLFTHPKVDIASYKFSKEKNNITSVVYIDDFPETHYFDEKDAALQKQLDQVLPGRNNYIGVSKKGRSIIESQTHNQPVAYLLYDRNKNALKKWLSTYPKINPKLLGTLKPISFKARDGMLLYGYVTLPPKAGKNLPPVVVYPHGGPWARDYAGFEPFAQALATRGYAVLQVNFRGSEGYGTKYIDAGNKQWGKKMQDDLTDGLKWLGKQKIADSSRACIMGMSYGGYAALMGVVKDPDQYKCAISFAGVADLVTLTAQEDSHSSFFDQLVGEQGSDEIKQTSPTHQAKKIKAPVLLVQGNRDVVVDVTQTKAMEAALKKYGKKHKVIYFKDGTHNLSSQEYRTRFIKESVAFLQKYLPVN